MRNLSKTSMNADQFLAWARVREERLELHDGMVVAPPRALIGHERVRSKAHAALRNAILRAGSACRVSVHGAALRVNAGNVFRPDVMVTLGPAAHDAIEITDPVIVVEVLSPSTARIDEGPKLAGYFSMPTVAHYLILDPERRAAIHHERGGADEIVTHARVGGVIRLKPPGLMIAAPDIFAPT